MSTPSSRPRPSRPPASASRPWIHGGLRVELDVTPAWWRGPLDAVLGGPKVLSGLAAAKGDLARAVVEVHMDTRRVVLLVVAPHGTRMDELEAQRVSLRRMLDASPDAPASRP
jgi:hypothetical protein